MVISYKWLSPRDTSASVCVCVCVCALNYVYIFFQFVAAFPTVQNNRIHLKIMKSTLPSTFTPTLLAGQQSWPIILKMNIIIVACMMSLYDLQ